MNNRHAYLILAHNEPEILKILVEMIDDERNDIYIHIDKKSDINQFLPINVHHSNLTLTERIKVNWGGWSMVEATLLLLSTARKKGGYGYYHLLSGVDLPLKTQAYIHSKLDASPTLEYFDFSFSEHNKEALINCTEWRYILREYVHDSLVIRRTLCSFARKCYLQFQKILNLKKNYNVELVKASNWFSVTEACCDYILSKASWLEDNFKYSCGPDEIAIPTLVFNSPFHSNVSKDTIRKIDWNRGEPYTWCKEDINELLSSTSLFARKFASNDMDFISKIKLSVFCK